MATNYTYPERIKQALTAAPGASGNLALGAAASGFKALAAGHDGASFEAVLIEEGTAWEVRTGSVYDHDTLTLTRGTLHDSSTGSAIAFTAAATLAIGPSGAGEAARQVRLNTLETNVATATAAAAAAQSDADDAAAAAAAAQTELTASKTLFYANRAAFPATGDTDRIYIAEDTGILYRWVSTDYVAITFGVGVDTSGNTVLVGADGVRITDLDRYPAPLGFEITPTDDVAMWNTDKTAALTVAVDTTVLYNGRPSLKITIPAGTSGTLKVGISGVTARTPYGWDKSNFALAVKHTGFTGYDWSSTFPPVPAAYLGDASYTNFFVVAGGSHATYPETKPRADDWFTYKPTAAQFTTGGGSPAVAATMRTKLQWVQVSQATDCYIHIGFFGVMPPRRKATLVWCVDDGYAEWDTFLKPLFKHYNMPVSMGISKDLVGQPGYVTAAQIQALHADESRLFDIVNHAVDNTGYNTLGAAAYYAQMVENLEYLRSLGINDDGPLHHPIVQSQWGNDLVDLMEAGGFLTARSSPMTAAMHGRDQLIPTGDDKLRWILAADTFLGNTVSLATAKGLIDTAVTAKDFFMIGGHEFKDSGGVAAYTWTRSDMEQLVGYAASLVDAGTLEVKSWSRWYADLTGRNCNRR